ncbi:MAG TPA: aminoglycoside phosphotransferase family protein, partial [Thermomicrobiales bacterium]|nr:aminoglycoside phosphotransferase family protein [Thermomicrobiales bacterium]
EVICHNDFAPYNMVFEQQRITGVIDFDMASPGPRLWDLAYLAYRLIPLTGGTNPDGVRSDEKTRLSRLDTLIAAYGSPFSRLAFLGMVQQRLRHLARFSEELADETGRVQLQEHAALYRSDSEYIQQLLAGLTAEPGTTA